jgi:hypothetical protein
MRRTTVIAAALTLSLTGASAASAADGTGSVADSLVATTAEGLLTIAGTGVQVNASPTPGTLSSAVGATVVTVSDLTGGTAGWSVTATYADPADTTLTKPLGGGNVYVSALNVTGDLADLDLKPAKDQPLSSPVKVASTGEAAGTGVTAFTASYRVMVPATAKTGEVYGGTVTYTVATVR